MNLSIRHWLAENNIEISQIKGFSQGQMTGIALRIIDDMEVKSPLPFDICTLAEVMELSLGVVWHDIGIFARLTNSILSLLGHSKPFKRNEATWLTFQVAYLQALEEVFIEEESLSRIWLQTALVHLPGRGEEIGLNFLANYKLKPLRDENLQALVKILRGQKLSDKQAEEALLMVANSDFVQKISQVALAWLVANSVTKAEAELIIGRLENKLLGHLITVVSENAATLVQLQKFFRLGSYDDLKSTEISWESDYKINLQREIYRASLIQKIGEPLFIESFSLQDIYVPLMGLPVKENHQPVDLMNWVDSQLEDLETITVIESPSGYGKTSFCQLFAARVAQEIYPQWIPIYINLSEISIGNSFQETIVSALIDKFDFNLSPGEEANKYKYLLILDDLNDIFHSTENKMAIASRANGVLRIFLQQLFKFQSEFKHKIVLTSQSSTLDNIFSEATSKLRRIQIQPWGQDEWKQWFANWAKVQSMIIAQNFFTLLKNNKAFSKKSHFLLSDFVSQPLILYLLGILHRDELLDDEILQLATNPQNTNSAVVLWEIYERLNQWLLGYPIAAVSQKILTPSFPTHIHRTSEVVNSQIKNRHPQEVINQMQAVALQILCSGRKNIDLNSDFNTLPAFYFKVNKKQRRDSIKYVENSTSSTTVEFAHSKLGEYLCAASIVSKLTALTKFTHNAYGEINFVVDSPRNVAEQLYHLFGYGILTQEIEELVIQGLRRETQQKFSFELLCSRLQPFWEAYSSGRWLDEGVAHKAWTYFQELQNPINVEQVNAAVGINIFLILSASYRETKQIFSPCGNPDLFTEFHHQNLIKLLAKTAVFHSDAARERIGEKSLTFLNLSKADLRQAMLAGVNLAHTNLSNAQLKDACLTGANLADADLTAADLTGANLTNANLTNAKFTGANLTGVNLSGVNLDLVNLSNACLFQAIIAEVHKETAVANGAVFSLEKFEELKRLLSYREQLDNTEIGEETEIAFYENSSIGRIESAEGEPNLPLNLNNDSDDETVLGINPPEF